MTQLSMIPYLTKATHRNCFPRPAQRFRAFDYKCLTIQVVWSGIHSSSTHCAVMNRVNNKVKRLIDLLITLESGREFTATDLQQILKVSRRTIFRDLNDLKDIGVPVLWDSTKRKYFLPTRRISSAKLLSHKTVELLCVMSESLKRATTSIPFVVDSSEVDGTLQALLGSTLAVHHRSVSEKMIIHFGYPYTSNEAETHFRAILVSATLQLSVRLKYYRVGESNLNATLLNPYSVFFCDYTWYVVGRSSVDRAIVVIPIHDIQSVERTDYSFTVPPRYNLNTVLGLAWRTGRERSERQEVVVKFSRTMARTISSRKWHKTQSVLKAPDGSVLFYCVVDGLEEISKWILSFGSGAEVIRPLKLRDTIADEADKIVKQYDDTRMLHRSVNRVAPHN